MTHAWLVAYASVIGAGHIIQGLPCQDASAYRPLNAECAIAVVCDGAGSCAHADLGAAQTVAFALTHFEALMQQQRFFARLPTPKDWQRLAKQTLLRVRTDLKAYSEQHGIAFNSLSCTLMVVLVCPKGLLVTHIGDGRAGYCTAAGEWHPMLMPFKGEEANQTVFITATQLDAKGINTYIESRVIAEPVKAFCLLSDGCERACYQCNTLDAETQRFYDANLPYPPFFNPNIEGLLALQKQHKTQAEINALWADFLTAGTPPLKTEMDDKTLLLAVRHA